MNNRRELIIKLILAYVGTFAIFNIGGFSASDIMMGVVYLILVLGRPVSDMDRREVLASRTVSIIWTISYAIYQSDRLAAGLENGLFAGVYVVLSIVGIYLIFRVATARVIHLLADYTVNVLKRQFNIRRWLIITLIVLMCLMPLFVLNCPGTMTVDSFDQVSQARGITPYSDHHPWVHTLIIGLFYSLGDVLGGVYAGICIYVIAQMILVSMAVAYVTECIEELGYGMGWQLTVFLGYVLYPYNLAYAITVWKDILFAASVLVLTITLYRIVVLNMTGVRDISLLVLTGLGTCLLRHNGLYAFVIVWIVALIYFIKSHEKKNVLKIIITMSVVLAISLIIKGPVQKANHVEEGDYAHNLAIPLQQIGRVVSANGSITDDELAKLEKINSIIYIRNNYVPGGADNMIQWVVAGDSEYLEAHKGEYLWLWMELGIRNPVAYLDAFVDITKGYYTTMMPEQIAYYGILPNHDGLEPRPLAGARVRIKINELCSKIQDMVPVYGIFYSMGAEFMLMVLGAAVLIVRKRYDTLVIYIPVIALTLTVIIATPLVADLRYAYSTVLAFPLITVLTLTNGRKSI